MDDSGIIELYWKRDSRAIDETDKSYGALCHSLANRILSDVRDSEECVNDTYMAHGRLYPRQGRRSLPRFSPQ